MDMRRTLQNTKGSIEDAIFYAGATIKNKWQKWLFQAVGALVLGSAIAILIAIICAIAYSGHIVGAAIIGGLCLALVVCVVKLGDAVSAGLANRA